MIDFGMPTLIETKTLDDCAALCGALGLSFVELNMNLPQYQLGKINTERFIKTAERYGIYYTIHLDENLNVSDFNPYVAEAYRRTVKETISTAKALNAPILNMHLPRGVYFTLPDRKVFLFDEYKETYLKSIADFRDECENEIGGSNIKICIENTDGYTDYQTEAADLMLKSPVFGLTFDIGHNHGAGGADEPMIMERAGRLYHVHMHDALGRKNHLALGTGELDLKKYLRLADERGCRVVLETKTVDALMQSVDFIGNL